jgi:lipid-binding SYLF domain-containing protein
MTTHQERQKDKNIIHDPTIPSTQTQPTIPATQTQPTYTSTDTQNLDENTRKEKIHPEKRNVNENLGMGMGIDKDKDKKTTTHQDKFSQESKPAQTSSSLNPDSQDYWYYCSHSYTSEISDDTKHGFGFDKFKSHGKKMDTLICNSNEMLREYFDLKYQLPFDLLQTCKGILFLRIWKGGLFVGGISGTGIVMARHNQKWSAPCAVSIGGLQIGFQVGIERVDDILLLRDDAALKLFIENGHFRLGVDASLAVGNYGRDSNMGVVMSEGGESKSIYSYSFAKGAFVGISLDGGTLSIDDKVNEEFYGRKANAKDIFYGDVPIPQHNNDFTKMLDLLNSFDPNRKMNESSNMPK